MDILSPQQLEFEFDNANRKTGLSPSVKIVLENTSQKLTVKSTVINFNDALMKRNKIKENNLYLQILDSVRDIG